MWSVSAIILFGLFLIPLLWMLWQAYHLRSTLIHLRKRIGQVSTESGVLGAKGLEELSQEMSRCPAVKDDWEEFEETLIREEDHTGRQRVYNTVQANEFFSEEWIVDKHICTRFFAAVPGILTGVGLLCTFCAILVALMGVTEDHKIRQGAIEDLVGGLSGKFVSSIVAIFCATVFLISERFAIGNVRRAHHQFITALNRKLSRRSAEMVLHELSRELREQGIILKRFGTDIASDLGTAMKNSVQEGITPLIERVAHALEGLTKERQESIAETLREMTSAFQTQLMGSTSGQFEGLAQTMQATASVLSSMNEQAKETGSRTEQLISALDTLSSKQSQASSEQITLLTSNMQEVVSSLHRSAEASSNQLSDSVEGVLRRIEETSAKQLDELRTQNERTHELFSAMSQAARDAASSSSESMMHSANNVLSRIDESTRLLNERANDQSEKMREMFEGLRGSVQQLLEHSAGSMQSSVGSVLKQSSEFNEAAAGQFTSLFKQHERTAETLNEARHSLESASQSFADSVRGVLGTFENFVDVSTTIKQAGTSLSLTVERLSRASDASRDTLSKTEELQREITSNLQAQSEGVARYNEVFRAIDEGLGRVLGQLGSSIDSFKLAMKNTLEVNLSEFDSKMGEATSRLSSTVKQLAESLDTLEDLIPPASDSTPLVRRVNG